MREKQIPRHDSRPNAGRERVRDDRVQQRGRDAYFFCCGKMSLASISADMAVGQPE
jgi:hypothetical protein